MRVCTHLCMSQLLIFLLSYWPSEVCTGTLCGHLWNIPSPPPTPWKRVATTKSLATGSLYHVQASRPILRYCMCLVYPSMLFSILSLLLVGCCMNVHLFSGMLDSGAPIVVLGVSLATQIVLKNNWFVSNYGN